MLLFLSRTMNFQDFSSVNEIRPIYLIELFYDINEKLY